jgi:hypothetical protein
VKEKFRRFESQVKQNNKKTNNKRKFLVSGHLKPTLNQLWNRWKRIKNFEHQREEPLGRHVANQTHTRRNKRFVLRISESSRIRCADSILFNSSSNKRVPCTLPSCFSYFERKHPFDRCPHCGKTFTNMSNCIPNQNSLILDWEIVWLFTILQNNTFYYI